MSRTQESRGSLLRICPLLSVWRWHLVVKLSVYFIRGDESKWQNNASYRPSNWTMTDKLTVSALRLFIFQTIIYSADRNNLCLFTWDDSTAEEKNLLNACQLTLSVFVLTLFTAQRSNASAVLRVIIMCVCPAVPSFTRVFRDKTKKHTAHIFIPQEMTITLALWYQQQLVGDVPSPWNLRPNWPTPFEKRRIGQISTYNVSTVRPRKKFNYHE